MKKQKILIVDDVEINRLILNNLFHKEYEIYQAENGRMALEIIRKEQGAINLVLLDIVMPVMNGKVFLQELRKSELYSSIPVVVISSEDEDNCAEVLELGAMAFIHKPFTKGRVVKCVKKILNRTTG